MFLGHFAAAFGAKRAAPRPSLGVLFAAAQLPDLVWPVFLLTGWERVRVTPSSNPFLVLEFTHYPWTHSLLAVVAWGLLAGAAYVALTRDRSGGLAVGLLVVSHWVLDYVTHRPDLPLYPGGAARVGLGLWHSVAATLIVEAGMFAAGVALYLRTTRARDRTGRYALAALVVFLLVLAVASFLAPPPADVRGLAWGALAGWLLPLWAVWADRHRIGPAV
jgi:hypothetical protein